MWTSGDSSYLSLEGAGIIRIECKHKPHLPLPLRTWVLDAGLHGGKEVLGASTEAAHGLLASQQPFINWKQPEGSAYREG